MRKRPHTPSFALHALTAALVLTSAVSAKRLQDRHLVPDAVTRATTWNSHDGEFATLADGYVPPAAEALPFVWETKGILVFEWAEPQPLERVRIFVGSIGNNYQIRAYVGGRLDETGTLRDPEGEQTALLHVDERVTDQWIDIPFPLGTRADNVELWALGPTIFYEVEIHTQVPVGTAVSRATWGGIKTWR